MKVIKMKILHVVHFFFPPANENDLIVYNNLEDFITSIQGQSSDRKEKYELLIKNLDRAYDIRKFEIDLYWKRAAYFWGFMIAIFASYFIVIDPAKKISPTYQFLVSCMGFIFSLGWYLVNRGSGYWLTHWERVIDAIETYLEIALYKANLQESAPWKLDGNYPHSVSRINLVVSLSICVVWLLLIFNFLLIYSHCKIWILTTLTSFVTIWLMSQTKSGKGYGDKYNFYKRGIKYDSDKSK